MVMHPSHWRGPRWTDSLDSKFHLNRSRLLKLEHAVKMTCRLLAIVLLGAGFWVVYARRTAVTDAAVCATAPSGSITKTLLWVGAIVVTLVLSSGWWGQLMV
jgi:hypothetical protein